MIYLLFVLVPCALFAFHFATRKYLNPYKLTFVFGKKGSGKSTLLAKYAYKYKSLGWSVYTTEGIPGTYMISASDIGVRSFPPHSCILIDEASLAWDNRSFKSMPKEVVEWYRYQRHHKCRVFLFSQTFDVDKKIRDLSDEMFLVTKKFRVFSYGKRILRNTVLIEASGEAPSRIDENLVFDSLFFFWAGSRSLTFIPAWIPFFNSFKIDSDLICKEFEYIPLREDMVFKGRMKKPRVTSAHTGCMPAVRSAVAVLLTWFRSRWLHK